MAAPMILRIGDREFKVEATPAGVVVDGATVTPAARAVTVTDGDRRLVFLDGEVFEFEVQRQGRRGGGGHHSSLTAPMPATVIRINVAPGAAVCPGAVGDPGDVAVLNLTPVEATGPGYGAVRASDAPSNNSLGEKAVSNVNFRLGSVDPNVAFASIGADRGDEPTASKDQRAPQAANASKRSAS